VVVVGEGGGKVGRHTSCGDLTTWHRACCCWYHDTAVVVLLLMFARLLLLLAPTC
jgi:hypothetical protein